MKKMAGITLFMLLIGLLPTAFAQSGGPFPDVSGSYVNADAIEYLKSAGVISGYPDGTYKPANEINRAEFTKIIIGSLYPDLKGKNCFPDVKEEWFAPYVCKAKELGVIEGYPDGTFKPEANINFSEASKIIANAYNVGGGETGGTWFQPFVTALEVKKDIPLSVEYFDENITRDEMAEMIYRLKAGVTGKATRTYGEISGEGFVKADSCAELKSRYTEMNAYSNLYPYSNGYEKSMDAPAMAPAPAMEAAPSGDLGGGGGTADYSTTNIQVAGVDEADIIKNDGKYIYIIKGNNVRIVEAYPAENLKELVTLTLGEESENFWPTEMYVDGNKLTVIGNASRYYPDPMPLVEDGSTTSESPLYPPYFGYNRTKVYVVDITDRSKPKVFRAVEFDGSYTTSRKVDGTLYLVMNQYIYYPYYDYVQPAATEPADAIVPRMLDTAKGTEELIAPCGDIYILPKPRDFNYLIAAAVPLDDLTKDVSRSVVVGNTGTVYASRNNLYVAATDWGDGYYRPYGDYDTAIYRFALGNGTIQFKNKGSVPGTILNQFSMDQHNNYFRVATVRNEYVPGSEINNNVYVLNSSMEIVGKVQNIAPGERLYAARFAGNTAYLVTFKRVDPLFVLDMTDPTDPVIKGKLKIPGYSTYLQPYDDTHLLGFGNEVVESEMSTEDFVYYTDIKGIKVSLFDVSDLENPKEIFKEVIGDTGSYSEVLYNHKALLFDKAKGLLAFPVTVYEIQQEAACSDFTYSTCPETSCQKVCVPSSCTYENGIKVCTADCEGENSCRSFETTYGRPTFDGAYVYNVDLTGGFTLKGKVTHYNEQDMSDLEKNGYTNYLKTIQRVLYMGETLYTVSQFGVKANALSDMAEKNMIELAGEVYNIYYGKA